MLTASHLELIPPSCSGFRRLQRKEAEWWQQCQDLRHFQSFDRKNDFNLDVDITIIHVNTSCVSGGRGCKGTGTAGVADRRACACRERLVGKWSKSSQIRIWQSSRKGPSILRPILRIHYSISLCFRYCPHTVTVYNRATIKVLIYLYYEYYATVTEWGQYPIYAIYGCMDP